MSVSTYPTLPARVRAGWQRRRQSHADTSTEWIMNREKWELWRLSTLKKTGFVAGLILSVITFISILIYAAIPERRVWQIQVGVGLEFFFIATSLSAGWLARAGQGNRAVYVYLVGVWIGPGFGAVLIKDFAVTAHATVFLAAFLIAALLLPKPQARKVVALSLIAWFLLSIVIYGSDIAAPSPEYVQVVAYSMLIAASIFIWLLAAQFYRLSLNDKLLLTFIVALLLVYQVALGYTHRALAQFAGAEAGIYHKSLQLILNLLIGVLAMAVLVIAQRITTPVTRLTEAAIQVRQGQLDAQAEVSSLDEIGVLSLTFNQMIAQLRDTLMGLEEQVANRTRDLQIAASVSQEITQVLTANELLPSLVEKTQAGFGMYFVSVYVYESAWQRLVLAAGSGEAGRLMQPGELSYGLEDTPSLVAQAARERRTLIVPDVDLSEAYFPNPYLPLTKSEATLPLIVQGELIGVLDVQASEVNWFDEATVQVWTTLAGQIAVAMKNAQAYEEQIQVAEKLRAVDRLKMQFLASMSHELRTPMNAIINFVEMVSTGLVGPVNAEQRELLEQSLQSSKHLLHLINDVLDISKIQAGKLTLFVEPAVSVQTELNLVLGMITPSLAGRDVELIQDIDAGLPLVSGDRRRIRQILLNLLANAVKFTTHGSITLSVKRRPSQILFAVIDTGPGLSQAAQEVIFEPFVQTANGLQQAEGTGLGLPIARSLAEAHGGRLWVDSQPGEGAAFFFTLPVADEPTSQAI